MQVILRSPMRLVTALAGVALLAGSSPSCGTNDSPTEVEDAQTDTDSPWGSTDSGTDTSVLDDTTGDGAEGADGSADGGGLDTAFDASDDGSAGGDTNAPPGYATLTLFVDDSANHTFSNEQIVWTGSFAWDERTNAIELATSWLPDDGPYPFLWDDGPISKGGHEREGEVAGDSIFTTEIYFEADVDTTIEYGVLNEFDNWMWIGANGVVEIPAGSTAVYDLPGLTLPKFGDVDIKLTVDLDALHADFAGIEVGKAFVKGTMNMWAPVQILDDGSNGDDAAADGVYTYVHSTKLGPHDGLLTPGQEAQFVFVFTLDPEGTADDGIEYKVGGNAAIEGIKAYTDAALSGTWEEVEVYQAPDSKGKTLNTAIAIPGEAPECSTDGQCPGGTCENGVCVPDAGEEEGGGSDDLVVLLIEPSTGPANGGTAVTITGAGFAEGASVTFGGKAATNVVVVSSSSLTCTTPSNPPGVVEVAVEVPSGAMSAYPNGFKYVDSVTSPVITSIFPKSGSVKGGTKVSVGGSGFASGAIITFGAKSAATTFISSSQLEAVTPSNQQGSVDVTVINPDGQENTSSDAFAYVPDLPDWASLQNPIEVTIIAGQTSPVLRVEVYEEGITNTAGQGAGLTVELGFGPNGSEPDGNASWEWKAASYLSDTGNNDEYGVSIVATAAGQFDFAARASVDGGQTWLYVDANGSTDGYTPANAGNLVVSAAPTEPTVLTMSPKGGSVLGGTVVTLSGVQLQTATAVMVGDQQVSVTASATQVIFTSPAASAGAAELTVKLANGTLVDVPGQFHYGLINTPSANGTLAAGEWPEVYSLASSATPTTWGEGLNELHTLYASFDATHLYIAIEGTVEAANAIVVYVDKDLGEGTGVSNMTSLGDNSGSLDDAISGILTIDVAGFGADFAAGSIGKSTFLAGAPLGQANTVGWRSLANPNDFGWLDGTVASGTHALELALPLATLFGGQVPTGGSEVGIVVRLGNAFGSAYSNQALPDAISGAGNTSQTSAASLVVFPL